MKMVAFCIALVLPFASRLSAQSIAGEWDAHVTTPVGVGTPKVIFLVQGDSVTGTLKRPMGDVPIHGTVRGNDLIFHYTITYAGEPMPVTVQAKLLGDSITGEMSFGDEATGTFTATRSVRPPKQ